MIVSEMLNSLLKLNVFKFISAINQQVAYDEPVISSGLHKKGKYVYGEGFQVFYSNHYSALMVSIQTDDKYYEAAYTEVTSNSLSDWNEFTFIWSRYDNLLTLLVNSTVANVTSGIESIPKTAYPGSDFINIGGAYDQLPTSVQSLSIKDLKIWRHNFTLLDLTKNYANKGV